MIAAMVGLDIRSTMDMDTTIKGIPANKEALEEILNEILSIELDDNVVIKLKAIKNIHDVSDYDDFRVSIEALISYSTLMMLPVWVHELS